MEKYTLPPRAVSLFESMLDIGHSLETAIASSTHLWNIFSRLRVGRT